MMGQIVLTALVFSALCLTGISADEIRPNTNNMSSSDEVGLKTEKSSAGETGLNTNTSPPDEAGPNTDMSSAENVGPNANLTSSAVKVGPNANLTSSAVEVGPNANLTSSVVEVGPNANLMSSVVEVGPNANLTSWSEKIGPATNITSSADKIGRSADTKSESNNQEQPTSPPSNNASSGSETSSPNTDVELDGSKSTGVIPYGKRCDPNNPETCQDFPTVACVTNSLRVSTCRCSYFRTWVPEEKDCVLNAFSPCSKGIPGLPEPDLKCGPNADCITDTLGINAAKFCRCRKGFIPTLNEDNIPSFCIPAPQNATEFLEEENPSEDYIVDFAQSIHPSLLISLLSILFLTLFPQV